MNKDEVVIYLNEPDGKVYVKVPEGYETLFQLQNLSGKIIEEEINNKALHDFELAGLPDGNYFVIVKQGDIIRSKKIVKGYHP